MRRLAPACAAVLLAACGALDRAHLPAPVQAAVRKKRWRKALRRLAYVAAIDRARFCIENYDGAPATRDALDIMISAYDGMGLKDLAERSREVYALNFPGEKPERKGKRDWWPFW